MNYRLTTLKKYALSVVLAQAISGYVVAQKPARVDNGYTLQKEDKAYGIYHSVSSKSLGKQMPVLVFLPQDYASGKRKYPVVYSLHGVNNQPITEQGIRELYNKGTKIQEMATLYNVIIVAPLTGNTFYVNSRIDTTQKIASYIGEDLPAYIDKQYNTLANRKSRILAGFSMGGYGAVSLLCRYPETFSVALNRAGVLDPATGVKDLYWDNAVFSQAALGSYWQNQEAYHLNSCFNLVNKISTRTDVAIVIEVGVDDFLYKTNRAFRDRLAATNIPHIYAEYPGGHVWDSNCYYSMFAHLQVFCKTME